VTVDEAYVHCSKHIPHLEPAPRPRLPTDRNRPKDSAYFPEPSPVHQGVAEAGTDHTSWRDRLRIRR